MLELNSDIALLGQFTAEALGRRRKSQVFQLRRMQTMGQSLNVFPKVNQPLQGSPEMILYTVSTQRFKSSLCTTSVHPYPNSASSARPVNSSQCWFTYVHSLSLPVVQIMTGAVLETSRKRSSLSRTT